MISKKAAGLIGLGATMTGAIGSQMTSANLSDLLNKEEQQKYTYRIKQIRGYAAALNIANKIHDLITEKSDDNTQVIEISNIVLDSLRPKVLQMAEEVMDGVFKKLISSEEIEEFVKNKLNVQDILKPNALVPEEQEDEYIKLRAEAKQLMDAMVDAELSTESKKDILESNLLSLLFKYGYELTPENVDKILNEYNNYLNSMFAKENTLSGLIELAKSAGVPYEYVINCLLETEITTGKGTTIFSKTPAYYELFSYEPSEENYRKIYEDSIGKARKNYKIDKEVFYIDKDDVAVAEEGPEVKNYYEKSGRGRKLVLNELGYYSSNIELLSNNIKKGFGGLIAEGVTHYVIPGGKLMKTAAIPLIKGGLSKISDKIKGTSVGKYVLGDKDENVPEYSNWVENKEVNKSIIKTATRATGLETLRKTANNAIINYIGQTTGTNNIIETLSENTPSIIKKEAENMTNFIKGPTKSLMKKFGINVSEKEFDPLENKLNQIKGIISKINDLAEKIAIKKVKK